MSTPMPSCMDHHYMNRYIPQNIGSNSQPQYYTAPGTNTPFMPVGCYPNANGWAGIPLISTAAQRRPRRGLGNNATVTLSRTQSLGGFDEQSITRLAIHAHGAPLISTGRYNSNRKLQKKDASRTLSLNEDRIFYANSHNQGIADTSGSGNSDENNQQNMNNGNETCLPRIIKPRKRRKKDRKPNQATDTNITNDQTQTNHSNATSSDQQTNNNSNSSNNNNEISHDNLLPPIDLINNSNICSCSCKVCDPFGRIWSTPLRRSCSDNSAEVDEIRRTKDVGVIGGDRTIQVRNEWRSVPSSLEYSPYNNNSHNNNENTRKSSLSDSGDSGCIADILSGLNITDDLLTVSRDLFSTPTDTNIEFQFPSFTNIKSTSDMFLTNNTLNNGNNNNNNNSDGNLNQFELNMNSINQSTKRIQEQSNINELTRKISETLDLKSDGLSSSDSGSVLSDSVFSDGVPDLFVNFDSISKNQLFSASNISKLSNLLFDDNLASPALVMPQTNHMINNTKNYSENVNNNNNNINLNTNNNVNNNNQHLTMLYSNNNNSVGYNTNHLLISNSGNNNHDTNQFNNNGYDQPFIFVPDKDRCSEILNCLDMVWNGGLQQN